MIPGEYGTRSGIAGRFFLTLHVMLHKMCGVRAWLVVARRGTARHGMARHGNVRQGIVFQQKEER